MSRDHSIRVSNLRGKQGEGLKCPLPSFLMMKAISHHRMSCDTAFELLFRTKKNFTASRMPLDPLDRFLSGSPPHFLMKHTPL